MILQAVFLAKHNLRRLSNERTFAKDNLLGGADAGGAVAIVKSPCSYRQSLWKYARCGKEGERKKDTASSLARV